MTEHQTFKRRVRSRMAKAGESRPAARQMLIDEPHEPHEPHVELKTLLEARPPAGA